MGGNFLPPQFVQVRHDFVGRPKDVSNTHDIMSLGYFDVSEHVSNIISSREHILDPIWDYQKNFLTKNGVFLRIWGPSEGNVRKMT